jgi:hypothetical protein
MPSAISSTLRRRRLSVSDSPLLGSLRRAAAAGFAQGIAKCATEVTTMFKAVAATITKRCVWCPPGSGERAQLPSRAAHSRAHRTVIFPRLDLAIDLDSHTSHPAHREHSVPTDQGFAALIRRSQGVL